MKGEFAKLDFNIKKKGSKTKSSYSSENLDLAYRFTKELNKELGDIVKAVVLFGSTARKEDRAKDIDILVIADDVRIDFTEELVQTYRLVTKQCVAKTSNKIHVTSMKLTSFWEYIRNGDPIALNILRDGFALIDTGFFDPLQILLRQGRIRPSMESLWSYFNRAPESLKASKVKVQEAMLDLYWAVIDSSHAVLMSINEVPPSPKHVPQYLEEHLVKKDLISKEAPWTVRKFYDIHKRITSNEIRYFSGEELDKHYREAEKFVKEMREFVQDA